MLKNLPTHDNLTMLNFYKRQIKGAKDTNFCGILMKNELK